jgi:hypothetical protein
MAGHLRRSRYRPTTPADHLLADIDRFSKLARHAESYRYYRWQRDAVLSNPAPGVFITPCREAAVLSRCGDHPKPAVSWSHDGR